MEHTLQFITGTGTQCLNCVVDGMERLNVMEWTYEEKN